MSKRIFRLVHDTARKLAAGLCMSAPDGYVVTISEPNKSREQEEKYHAMIGDIADQCEYIGKRWDAESWKRLLIDEFVDTARNIAYAEGKQDPFAGDGKVIPSMDGRRVVQLGIQSRKFTKAQARDFIEFLYSVGAERGVVWSGYERLAA